MRNRNESFWGAYKIIFIVSLICVILGYVLFSGDDPPVPVDTRAIELAEEALRMLQETQDSIRSLEIVEVLLMGMGYVVSICVPAAVVCFFIYLCRKE